MSELLLNADTMSTACNQIKTHAVRRTDKVTNAVTDVYEGTFDTCLNYMNGVRLNESVSLASFEVVPINSAMLLKG